MVKRNEILRPLKNENAPSTPVQQRVTKVNSDGTTELTDPTGKITKVKSTDLQSDPADPTGKKLQATVSAPVKQIQPGAQVSVTTASESFRNHSKLSNDLDVIKKLSGLR